MRKSDKLLAISTMLQAAYLGKPSELWVLQLKAWRLFITWSPK